jgi:hypothetical protein
MMLANDEEVLNDAMTKAERSGGVEWVNGANIVVLFSRVKGNATPVWAEFVVLTRIDALGDVLRHRAFALDARRHCVRELRDDEPITARILRHIALTNYSMSVSTHMRQVAEFMRKFSARFS